MLEWDLERLLTAGLSGFDRLDHPIVSVALTLGVFLFRGYLARRTARDNAAAQLISIQRHLSDIAFGRGGGAKLPDHVSRTLRDQFITRIDDVKAQAKAAGLNGSIGLSIDRYRDTVQTFFDHWEGYTNATNKMRGWYSETKHGLHEAMRSLGRYRAFRKKIETDENGNRVVDADSVGEGELSTFDKNQMGYPSNSAPVDS